MVRVLAHIAIAIVFPALFYGWCRFIFRGRYRANVRFSTWFGTIGLFVVAIIAWIEA